MDFADAELIAEFAIESQEGLANIEQQMLTIEADGAEINVDLVNAVFRTMHSIKGTAGFLGLDRIGTLAHGLEEVLNRMRNREIVPSSELVNTILHASDYMKRLIDAVESSNEADITPYVESLQQFRAGPENEVVAVPVLPVQATPAEPVADTMTLNETTHEFIMECQENLDLMDRDLMTLEQNPAATHLLRGIFRTMHTIKGGAGFLGLRLLEKLAHAAESLLGFLRDGELQLDVEISGLMLSSIDKCREALRLLEIHGSDGGLDILELTERMNAAAAKHNTANIAVKAASSPGQMKNTPASPSAASQTMAKQNAPHPATSKTPAREPNTEQAEGVSTDKQIASAGDTTIRVDVALLDKLMTRVGELVLARNQMLQHSNRLLDAEFVSTAQRLNLITTELQEGVMKTRMQPIGNVWSKFPRVIRDLAAQLGKEIRLEMEGKETELDKTILEAIKDPLTHLVRNSVDHGIETPVVRTQQGKPAGGCLKLRAYHEGGQVNIEITDDGAGLNLERIRQKAVEKGIVTADQAARLSERETAQLILLPGFSTAEKVTSVSGRGVGMDVVKTNIEKIGGTLDLQSIPGQGTTIKIKIPLTLAIIPALIVTAGGERYAIPQVSLQELVLLEGDEVQRKIEYVHGTPVFRLRGKLLPLVDLAERLGMHGKSDLAQTGKTDREINIVVLQSNDRQYGLVVEKVSDTEEIVVKPLSRQLKGIAEYAGTTIMGEGSVALILDVLGIAIAAGLTAEHREQFQRNAQHADNKARLQTQTLLIVDLGDKRRFALPSSMIARLETVPSTALEYADHRQVIQYRGSILPLISLSEILGVPYAHSESEELQIIVYADREYHCGFVVRRIVDIVESDLAFSPESVRREHLLGSMVIHDRVTDVLDLPNIARQQAHALSAPAMQETV